MSSIVQEKWVLNRRKNEKARELRQFALDQPQAQEPELTLEKPATLKAYGDGYLYLGDSGVWDHPDRIWALIDQLQDWLATHHPEYWKALRHLQAQDAEAARHARLAKILGAIGNNLDDLPELKDEIIRLGDMLSRGEDVRNYCRSYGESNGSGSSNTGAD